MLAKHCPYGHQPFAKWVRYAYCWQCHISHFLHIHCHSYKWLRQAPPDFFFLIRFFHLSSATTRRVCIQWTKLIFYYIYLLYQIYIPPFNQLCGYLNPLSSNIQLYDPLWCSNNNKVLLIYVTYHISTNLQSPSATTTSNWSTIIVQVRRRKVSFHFFN